MTLIWLPSQMATFAKVVELNGFSAAARALKVPKAAVSRAIAELEQALGLRLLERTTRRIHLTAAGSQLLPRCREILAATDAVRAQAELLTTVRGGPLRVRSDAPLGRLLLAPLVPRFLERFPDIPLEVELGETGADAAATAAAEVVIRVGASPAEGHVARALGSPPRLLAATPGYLQKRGLPVRPEELEQHDLLLPEAASAGTMPVLRLQLASRRAEVALRPKLAVDDPAVVHAAMAAGWVSACCRSSCAARALRPTSWPGCCPTGSCRTLSRSRPNSRRSSRRTGV
ncbi:MAG: LysR family transcriptional regulator [Steroidobacteraceae bacterium]